jgi:hypothetical protein
MSKVFIGGSRSIGRLPADARHRIDRIVEKRLTVLVGDANGTDKAVQRYLHGKRYDLVEVFCAGGDCRNNVGGWPVRAVSANGKRKDFAFFAAKDRAMAAEASVGLMLWDGKSKGTPMNVLRLVAREKPAVVYVASTGEFLDLKTRADVESFLARCAPELRQRLEREAAAETRDDLAPRQAALL